MRHVYMFIRQVRVDTYELLWIYSCGVMIRKEWYLEMIRNLKDSDYFFIVFNRMAIFLFVNHKLLQANTSLQECKVIQRSTSFSSIQRAL